MNKFNEQLMAETGIPESKNFQLLKREEVPGTPFILVGNDEEGWMITIGRFAVSERSKHKEDLIEKIEKRDYELLMSLISVCTDAVTAVKEEERMARAREASINRENLVELMNDDFVKENNIKTINDRFKDQLERGNL